MPQITFFAPCRLVLWREDADDTDITEGGIDLEIIVTGSSSDGKAKVEGWGSGDCSLDDWLSLWSVSAEDVSLGVKDLISRLWGSSLIALIFGMLERSAQEKLDIFLTFFYLYCYKWKRGRSWVQLLLLAITSLRFQNCMLMSCMSTCNAKYFELHDKHYFQVYTIEQYFSIIVKKWQRCVLASTSMIPYQSVIFFNTFACLTNWAFFIDGKRKRYLIIEGKSDSKENQKGVS